MGNPFGITNMFPHVTAIAESIGDIAGDVGLAVVDVFNGSEITYDTADVQNRFNAEREHTRAESEGLTRGFTAGTHNATIDANENYDYYSIAQLRSKVDGIRTDRVEEMQATWQAISDKSKVMLDDFRQAILGAIADKWDGAAAAAAARGVTKYCEESNQLTLATALLAHKFAELNSGLQPTVELVPHAPEHSLVDKINDWSPGPNWQRSQHEDEAAKREAVRILETVYRPVVVESASNVPVIPQPYRPTSDSVDTSVSIGGTGNFGIGGGGADSNFRTPVNSDRGDFTTLGSASQSDNALPVAAKNDPLDNGFLTDPLDQSAATTAASAGTANASLPSSSTNGWSGPGMPSGSGAHNGSGGFGGGSAGSVGSFLSSPLGSAQSANLASARPGGGFGAGGVGAAGRSGPPGVGGMAPHGSRGKGGDDREHKTADYLISADNGSELIGKMPKVAPPVIGQ